MDEFDIEGKTWFRYRGNKQFQFEKSVFGAKFDPNGHKNCENKY